jgi:hypothetical protein
MQRIEACPRELHDGMESGLADMLPRMTLVVITTRRLPSETDVQVRVPECLTQIRNSFLVEAQRCRILGCHRSCPVESFCFSQAIQPVSGAGDREFNSRFVLRAVHVPHN